MTSRGSGAPRLLRWRTLPGTAPPTRHGRRRIAPYVLLLPFYALFATFTLWPLLQNILISFQRVDLTRYTWIGLKNYQVLFADPVFLTAVRNTVVLSAGLVPLTVVLSLAIAVVATALPRGPRNFYRIAFYLPAVASATVISIVFLWILNPIYGLLNYAIGLVGIPPVAWLGNTDTALFSIMLVVLTFSVGVPVILFMAGLDAIPRDLYEAARIDGAGARQAFRSITLPLLRPTLAFVLITSTIASFQVFTVVQLLTQGGPANATQTVVYGIYQTAFVDLNFGGAAAASVLLMMFGLGIALIQMRVVNRDIAY